MMTGYVTTGIRPLAIGSMERFLLRPRLDGLPWDLTGGSVVLKLADPAGTITTITGTVLGFAGLVPWLVAGLAGTWLRAWFVTDGTGLVQVSDPIAFTVISSPI